MSSGFAADLGTLLSEASPSPPDVAVGAGEPPAAHRGVLWARVPCLREQLKARGATSVALPEGVSDETFQTARQWLYKGELPRPHDDGPLSAAATLELLALARAWDLPALALQGRRGAVMAMGGLLGVARPQIQALCDDFSEAFADVDDTPFFDVLLECTGSSSSSLDPVPEQPEPEPEPEPVQEPQALDAEPVMCRGNRAALCCRSGFFRAMLSPSSGLCWSETTPQRAPLLLTLPFNVHNFETVNSFLHTGHIALESIAELRFAVELADYFDISALHERCGDYIIEALSVETACVSLHAVCCSAITEQFRKEVLVSCQIACACGCRSCGMWWRRRVWGGWRSTSLAPRGTTAARWSARICWGTQGRSAAISSRSI